MIKNDTILTIATALIAICAVVLTVGNVREAFARRNPSDPLRTVDNWQRYVVGGQTYSSAAQNPKATIVMFSDYECPACVAFWPTIRAIRDQHTTDINLVIRHFPLDGHPFAYKAAIAAVCASEQGRFEAFHDLLMSRDEPRPTKPLVEFARLSGVQNLAAFTACLESQSAKAAVDKEIALGRELGLPGTPSLLVNDELHFGAIGLNKTVEKHLRRLEH